MQLVSGNKSPLKLQQMYAKILVAESLCYAVMKLRGSSSLLHLIWRAAHKQQSAAHICLNLEKAVLDFTFIIVSVYKQGV